MMADLHYFAFYPRDFASDGAVEAMSTKAVGAYILLLCKAWFETPAGTIPDDDMTLARWARMSDMDWDSVKAEVMAAFRKSGGRWKQKRLAEEYAKAHNKSEALSQAGRKGAEARYRPGHSQAMPTEQQQQQKQNRTNLAEQHGEAFRLSGLAADAAPKELLRACGISGTTLEKLAHCDNADAGRIRQVCAELAARNGAIGNPAGLLASTLAAEWNVSLSKRTVGASDLRVNDTLRKARDRARGMKA